MRRASLFYTERKPKPDKTLDLLILSCIAAGIVMGFLFANLAGYKEFDQRFADILLKSADNINELDLFLESFLKYGKYAVIIWLMAFIPRGFFISLFTLSLRGFGYGYTTGLLLNSFGTGGIKYVITLYLAQMILSFFGYYFVTKASFQHASKRAAKVAQNKETADIGGIFKYILALSFALLFEMICTVIELKLTRNLLIFI